MKRRLVQEGLIYCILPVIAIGGFYNQYRGIPWMILGVGFLYTFNTKRREDRINYTFLTFLPIYFLHYRQNTHLPKMYVPSRNVYANNSDVFSKCENLFDII